MYGPPGGVNIMADNTPSPFLGIVHMDEVEIFLPVSKSCGRGCIPLKDKFLIMTFKTEGIGLNLKRGVE